MPAQELSHRHQKALYWAPGNFDEAGEWKRAAGGSVELLVRWTNRKRNMLDPQGNLISVDATVIADRDLKIGGTMWEGSLQDLADVTSGTGTGTDLVPTSDLHEVVAFDSTPDVRGRVRQRTAGLRRLSGKLPSA